MLQCEKHLVNQLDKVISYWVFTRIFTSKPANAFLE